MKILEAPTSSLRVVLPSGLVIEGLDLAQAIELAKLLRRDRRQLAAGVRLQRSGRHAEGFRWALFFW